MLALPPSPGPVLGFGVDTFAFRNDSRIHHRGKPDIYCNRCFLMARAVGQFRRFARFEADGPRLMPEAYAARVWQVIRRGAWRAPLPADRRVVIPGYPSLHAFTGAEEAAVKAGLRGRFWTLVHPTNWRMTPRPPLTATVPDCAAISPAMSRTSVVLPAPFGPTSAAVVPSPTRKQASASSSRPSGSAWLSRATST